MAPISKIDFKLLADYFNDLNLSYNILLKCTANSDIIRKAEIKFVDQMIFLYENVL